MYTKERMTSNFACIMNYVPGKPATPMQKWSPCSLRMRRTRSTAFAHPLGVGSHDIATVVSSETY